MSNPKTKQPGAQGTETPDWLTPKDVQRELQIGEKLTYRLLRDGTIPSVRVGGVYRIHRPHLEESLGIHVNAVKEL
ncbi:MAG: helix-turn-helix domain-containing protein [Actinobacteria bacterium]|nr:helix-turn-helix domain-containing protein [Actinomycetota bacterium]MCA1739648.1 helix-turn-helix domain-containing protein [Actinomycetota bacterium]